MKWSGKYVLGTDLSKNREQWSFGCLRCLHKTMTFVTTKLRPNTDRHNFCKVSLHLKWNVPFLVWYRYTPNKLNSYVELVLINHNWWSWDDVDFCSEIMTYEPLSGLLPNCKHVKPNNKETTNTLACFFVSLARRLQPYHMRCCLELSSGKVSPGVLYLGIAWPLIDVPTGLLHCLGYALVGLAIIHLPTQCRK